MDFRTVILDEKSDSLSVLTHLIDGIRPGRLESVSFAVTRIRELIALLGSDSRVQQALAHHARTLAAGTSSTSLFTQSGLFSTGGFFSDIVQKIKHLVLPPLRNPEGMDSVVNAIFRKPWDHRWVREVPDVLWLELLRETGLRTKLLPDGPELNEFLNSILIVSHRIAVLGLDPTLVSKVPGISNLDSPFFQQNREITSYVDHLRSRQRLPDSGSVEYKYILNTLENCVQKLLYVRLHKDKIGASMNLTFLARKLSRHVRRIRVLLKILHEKDEDREMAIILFFKELVYNENTKYSISRHIASNTGLLAYQVSEHAAKTGEHYIASDRKEYGMFLLYAMGGGCIVAIMVVVKMFIYHMHYPPFIQAFFNGLNYGIGFLIIHFAGFTLATKQPAMTASKLAGSLEGHDNDRTGIANLATLIVKISRTQFISFAGNLIMVFPVSWLLSYLIFLLTGSHPASTGKAQELIAELHPVHSLTVWYAAIAGVLLFSAGLISGYFDNKSVFHHIPGRIRAHPGLRWISGTMRDRIARYLGNNLGSMAGNFILGFMLAFMGFFGFILGLPLDVRHVTFVTGNFGLALECLEMKVDLQVVVWTIIAIFLTGLVNFLVSFGLAIYTAIKARNVRFSQTRNLMFILAAWLFTYPLDFFFPPSGERKVPSGDHE